MVHPGRKAKILLVDDRRENLLALEAILQSLDQDLVTAESGEDALKRLLVDDYAVILLDVQMPGMDGFETAAHIKQRERTRHTPIVFLTATSPEPSHTFRGYAAGAVDYLSKPFDPWVLRAKVAVFIELFEKNRLLEEQARRLQREVELGVTREFVDSLRHAEDHVRQALEICGSAPPEQVTKVLDAAVRELSAVRASLPPTPSL
ncbi:MAG TPA: response regulator [Mycobacteriales bacterium]|nr:response regulator [Mycobacteriales bacterium]